MAKKVLIVGASGSLGQELMKEFSKDYDVSGTYFNKFIPWLIPFDMTNENNVKKIIDEENPEIVMITAAKTNVGACETHPLESYKVNVKGIENIVKNCEGRKIIFYSTDGIFDGTKKLYSETDEPNPVNVYGKHKLKAESLVKEIPGSLIIRSSRHYGFMGSSGKYLNNVISSLSGGKKIKAPIGSEGNFTFIQDLTNASFELVKKGKEGIYNIAGRDAYSLYEASMEIARIFNFDKSLIHPVDKDYFNKFIKRPSCPLELTKLFQEGISMKNLEEGLIEIKKGMTQDGRL